MPIVTEAQKKWVCLCYLCYPKAQEICELIPGCYLFENEGRWGLMCQPGHRDDHAILFFPEKPWVDPDPECDHVDDAIAEANDRWIDTVSDWSETVLMSPGDGYFLTSSCIEAGWKSSEHGFMLFWLFDFAGKKLEEHDIATQTQSGLDDGSGAGSTEPNARSLAARGHVQS